MLQDWDLLGAGGGMPFPMVAEDQPITLHTDNWLQIAEVALDFDPFELESFGGAGGKSEMLPLVLPADPMIAVDADDWVPIEGGKISLDQFGPQFGAGADDATDLGEIVVEGPGKDDDPYDDWWENGWPTGGGGSEPGGGTGEGGGGGDAPGPDTTGLAPHAGPDCAANAIKASINALPTNNTKEHVAIVFRGSDGQYYNSPPFAGSAGRVGYQDLGVWMAAHGVGMSDVVGLYHNHPLTSSTAGDPDVYRYPSNQNSVLGGANDWGVAGMFVSGANNSNAASFVMYVEDQNGDVRAFRYADRAQYENMTPAQMAAAANLPPPAGTCPSS